MTPDSEPQPLTVMTFNVLCSFCDRRFDPWNDRLEYFRDIFERHDPDLLGLQEVSPAFLVGVDEVEQLRSRLSGHTAVYFNPPDDIAYPDGTILFRTSRFELLDQGVFWLSPTPDVVRSTGFAAVQLPRLFIWVRLLDLESRRELYFATTHYDNNAPSQERSAPLTQERMAPLVERAPLIMVGDFNSRPSSNAYRILTTDASRGFVFENAYDLAPSPRIISNQTPPPEYDPADRIDHIFLAGRGIDWIVTDWAADLTVYGPRNRYPSDHFAIVAEVNYDPHGPLAIR